MTDNTMVQTAGDEQVRKKESMWTQAFKRLLKNPTATVGLIILVILVLLSILAPLIAPYDINEMDPNAIYGKPSRTHLLGADSLGRDYLSRLLYGGRYSLTLGLSAALLSASCSIVLGSVAGYFSGLVENLIMRLCDIIQAIPGQLMSIIISAVLGPGFFNTILALSLGGIAGGTRMLRGQVLTVRKEEYLEAAQTVNCTNLRIMFKHILPNVLSPIIVSTTMSMGNTIMAAAGLSVLGLGIQPPTPEWGAMLSAGRNYIRNYPHLVLYPGIMIFITVLSFNLFGDGLRDSLDPKLKK